MTTDHHDHPFTDDITLGLSEAAAVCGVHVDTLRRALRARRIPGAVRAGGTHRPWRLPVTGLRAAGFDPDHVAAPPPSPADALRQLAAALVVVAESLEVQP